MFIFASKVALGAFKDKKDPTFHFSSWLTVKDPTKAMSPF